MLLIAPENLSPAALSALIEDFVTRDGTDYGRDEVSLSRKAEQLRGQLSRGEVVIVFDEDSESVSLMTREQLAAVS